MKVSSLFAFFFSLLAVSPVAFATLGFDGTYAVQKYTWCNGPIDSRTVGCWPYGWQGVDLGKLSEIVVQSDGGDYDLTVTDQGRKSWSSKIVVCAPGQTEGCNASQTADALEARFGNPKGGLRVRFKGNQIAFLVWTESLNSHLVLTYTKR